MEQALAEAAAGLWSTASLGAGWRNGAAGVRELDGLMKLAMAVDGKRLFVGTSPERVAAVLARRNRAANPSAVYAAEWRHAPELPNFEPLLALIDFPQGSMQSAAPGNSAAREPRFFSWNLVSLGRALRRVQTAPIT